MVRAAAGAVEVRRSVMYVDGPGDVVIDFGKWAGRRLDALPSDYLQYLAANAWQEHIRDAAEAVLADRHADDFEDPLQFADPSDKPAALVLPLLAFEWEQRVRADLGEVEPGTAEAVALDRGVRHLRAIVSDYTGRAWLDDPGRAGA